MTNCRSKITSMKQAEADPDEAAEMTKGEKKNGVYLIGIEKVYDCYLLHPNDYSADPIPVDRVRVNGQYLGLDDRVEMECRDYEVVDGSRDESAEDFQKWVLQITMAPEDD